jgi:hypothetical protein
MTLQIAASAMHVCFYRHERNTFLPFSLAWHASVATWTKGMPNDRPCPSPSHMFTFPRRAGRYRSAHSDCRPLLPPPALLHDAARGGCRTRPQARPPRPTPPLTTSHVLPKYFIIGVKVLAYAALFAPCFHFDFGARVRVR